MRQFKRHFLATLLNALLPPSCPGCMRRIAVHGALCGRCWSELRFLEKPWCERLGTPFALPMEDGALSAPAIAEPPVFDRLRSAVVHDGIARRLVVRLKFHDGTELARLMAGWMLRAGQELVRDADLVVPVPLHRLRLLRRRYNQSAELARELSHLCGKRFAPQLLRRTRMTRQQVGLGARERADNVRGAFRVPEAARPLLAGRRILLVDDVYTTGATVSAATRALLKAGAGHVDVITFGRVLPGSFSSDGGGLYT